MMFSAIITLALVTITLGFSVHDSYPIDTQPEQVHISLGSDATEMMITWLTVDVTPIPVVEYRITGGPLKQQTGYTTQFTDGGSEKRVMYIHRVLLQELEPATRYYYNVGSDLGWSNRFTFRTHELGPDWDPTFILYGDLGNINGKSIPRIQEEVQFGNVDAVLHVGDMAYNLDSENGRVGDQFMRQIEPIGAYVPYQVVVGNHEEAYNFSNYVNRFSMMNQRDSSINNHFYSFNVGPVHFISFSTEFYFYVEYGWTQIAEQFAWLERDLLEANKPENRLLRPWIVTMGHRPMYCSTNDTDDCRKQESIIRKGLPILHAYGLEDLFKKFDVDIEFYGHEHTYERLWPVYDQKVYNGSYEKPYTNPGAPVHIITGSAGCQEYLDPFIVNPAPWSAVRISDYGYTKMMVHNKTTISFEQISDDQNGKVLDSFVLHKDKQYYRK